MHEFQVVGRKLPSDADPSPKLYKMRLFAPNKVVAKSRFFYFMNRLKRIKRTAGEIVSLREIFEQKPMKIKNFGIWLRYNSRSSTHNMYKEYRELTRADAVRACYQDLAARHRARFPSIHIMKVSEVANKDVRRPYLQQLLTRKVRFPLPHHTPRAFKPLFAGRHPGNL